MLTEQEIAGALFDLARMGVYVEPTAAQPAAALGETPGDRHDPARTDARFWC